MSSSGTLPIDPPTPQYKTEWWDAYYNPDRHHKTVKPKYDLIVRGLHRPHDDYEADGSLLPLYRYSFQFHRFDLKFVQKEQG